MKKTLPKIGIDARLYGPEQGGLGRYIQQLIAHLEILDPGAEFSIFLRSANWDAYSPQNPRFKKILADIPWYSLSEQILLPRIFNRAKLDLLHVPHWNIPIFYRRPFVTTIHDLLLLNYPSRRASALGPIKYWLKNLAFKKILNHAILNSRHIFTPSNFSKQDILKNFPKINSNKITVTPLAPAPLSPPTTYRLQQPTAHNLLTKHKITKPYALYVGVAYPHKNLEGLVKAWAQIEKIAPQQYQLVFIGKKNYFYNRLINSPDWKKLSGAIYTDFVDDADLPALYQNATLYVHPSFYEGSALPAFEAMQNNLAVAASDSSCLPELLKTAAAYFDPADSLAMANTILRLLNNHNERAALIKSGQNLISSLSWESVAKTTWDSYQKQVL
ncbi:MAG: glycosyltransferase family 1 protein [Candidatus Magasanikbacteria bacterium]|nr:glycosyltransferase family 1 protein [Candidatus Magasanikbacteria bacterium]